MTNNQLPTTNDQLLRADLQAIANLIPVKAGVLDLGCGDGDLLAYLAAEKGVRGRGIELSEEGVLACVGRGLSVRQGNLEEGLADYPNASFNYVVLSQTLPYLDNPAQIVQEMLRVGQQAIVSFSNWGYWRCRLQLLATGRIPPAPDWPEAWHAAPRWQAVTVADFLSLANELGVRITQEVYLANGRTAPTRPWLKNLLATTAVYVMEKGN
ncbi:MAG: methionine biosynthesis protein MetW [Ardenticatenaceae bacterium]|nr:methionine biosynthesis protein MetW [Ardenticatenaceae bacterium]MCB8989372.1 methionine biosynthesis protein MetW [Ardenticatenaceae bacterium]MCB9004527.1 methionine biosynthesis protein MetW [Ardenticatenaceae bacterium]